MKKGQKNPKSKDLDQRKKELFRLLLTNEKCSFEYLANSLEVSRRTVKRYLDELEETVPLHFTTGRYSGGVQLVNKTKNQHLLKKAELYVLEKIVSETEQTGNCVLNESDLILLKEIIYRYS